MRRLFVALLVLASASCGGGSSSSPSPTSPSTAANATLTVTTISAVAEVTGTHVVYHVTFTLHEGGGQAGATIAAVDLAFSNGTTSHTNSPMQTTRIAAGGSLDSKTIDVAEASGRGAARSVTATVSYTDDGNHTGTVTSTSKSITAPTQTFTLSGIVKDSGTAQPIYMALVSIGRFAFTTTDHTGHYSFAQFPGGVALTVTASATGYAAVDRDVTLFAGTSVDFALATPQTPAVTPDVEYRVNGTSTRADHILYADSSGSTVEVGTVALPWSHAFSGAQAGQSLSLTAQNGISVNCIRVQIFKSGVLYKESQTCDTYGTATVTGSY